MNCRDSLERLNTFLDRELSEDEVQEVHVHLENCPPCVHHFRFESSVKRLVKRSCGEERASVELRARVSKALRECY
jgi:mycothiol system anti-sigma-R factor